MKTAGYVILLMVSFAGYAAAADSAAVSAIETIETKIDQCMLNNTYNLSYMENCLSIADQALAETGHKSRLMWEYAGMIRRKLGNNFSLTYYKQALQENVTPERCIDDGLDLAVKSGLDLSAPQFSQEIAAAQEIVFKRCWDEFKEEIIAVSKDRTSTVWHENVSAGARSIHAEAQFAKCH